VSRGPALLHFILLSGEGRTTKFFVFFVCLVYKGPVPGSNDSAACEPSGGIAGNEENEGKGKM